MHQRPVDDVGVAHHPADVGGGPEHLAWLDAVEVVHRPGDRHHMAGVVAHHALGRSRRARGVDDIERVAAGERRARGGAVGCERGIGHARPVVVAARDQGARPLRALQHEAGQHLVAGHLDGRVEQRLVFDDASRLDAARGGHDQLGRRVVDAGGEFAGRKTAEHHRVDRADAGARQHGEHRFGHHGHVDDDTVALADGEVVNQHACERADLAQHLRVGVGALGAGHRAVVDERRLLGAPRRHLAVEGIVAGVAHRVGKPAAADPASGSKTFRGGFDQSMASAALPQNACGFVLHSW